MDRFQVTGRNILNGTIKIGGAKNAVLPIMAATIISPGKYCLKNVPALRDTYTMKRLLEMSGAVISFNNNIMNIDTSQCANPIAPYELVKTMRASFYVLGPFMSRFNYAEVSLPGGCAWGPRPVDFHLMALEKLGADVTLSDGMIVTKGRLKGATISFSTSSVGATGNTIMAAVKAEGDTIIENAATEPEIDSLCLFLKKMGANIDGIGTKNLIIRGVKKLHADIEYEIIPDRIEAGTFLLGAAITKGDVLLENVNPNHMQIFLEYLKKTGIKLEINTNSIHVHAGSTTISPLDMDTDVYPGFPTDLQAQWMSYMTCASGSSIITENIYTDRFTHIAELCRFGADIRLSYNKAYINGNDILKAAPVMSTDIRASASLIIAALAAEGTSTISRIYHIDRGYENIEIKLQSLGADIKRISE